MSMKQFDEDNTIWELDSILYFFSLVFNLVISIKMFAEPFNWLDTAVYILEMAAFGAAGFWMMTGEHDGYHGWIVFWIDLLVKKRLLTVLIEKDKMGVIDDACLSYLGYGVLLAMATILLEIALSFLLSKCRKIRRNRRAVKKQRKCILKEERVLDEVSGIPVYIGEDMDSVSCRSNPMMKRLIDSGEIYRYIDRYSCLTDEEKTELYQLFQKEDSDIWLTNEQRYVYLDVIDRVIRETSIKYEKLQDTYDFPFDKYGRLNVEGFATWKEKVEEVNTSNSIELAQRVEKEILVPFREFYQQYYAKYNPCWYEEFKKELNIISSGVKGEETVREELEQYSRQFEIISNVHLVVHNNSIESDIIVISQYGVFVLEVKNLGSGGKYSLKVEKDGRWQRVFGERKEEIPSPVQQNERHAIFLEEYLNDVLGNKRGDAKYIQVKNMVVIANNAVDIDNQSNNIVTRCNNIVSLLRGNPIVLSEEDIERITRVIKEAMKPHKKYAIKNFWKEYKWEVQERERYNRLIEGTIPLREYIASYNEKVVRPYID